ncbi:hypothetical protein D9M72_434790 [compost metagenome]
MRRWRSASSCCTSHSRAKCARVPRSRQRSFDARKVASAFGSGMRARAASSANAANPPNSARRPSDTALARSGPKSQKNWNGVEAANSSPMNSIGTCGDNSRQAMAARTSTGSPSAWMRSPKARLPTWSCVCRNDTKAVEGSRVLGSPRASPWRKADGCPW